MNIIKFAIQNQRAVVSVFILATIIFILWPLWRVTSIDEEEFRFAIVSTVLHARALLEGYYPFWTSYFGFGMPHPFIINFNYHPLLFAFAFNVDLAIQLMYAVHLSIGALGMFHLCRVYTGWYLALLGVVSYLLASPNMNYLYTDFWPTAFIGWSLLPLLIYTGLRLATSDIVKEQKYLTVALGVLVGMLGLNAHPSQALIYVMSFLLILSGYYYNIFERLRFFLFAAIISMLIISGKFYYLASEAQRFSTQMMIFKEPFGWADLWSIILRPIVVESPSYIFYYNLEKGSRLLFMGGPLVVTALVTTIWRVRKREIRRLLFALVVLISIYVIRPDIMYSFVSALSVWREPIIVLMILVGLSGIEALWRYNALGRKAAYVITITQVGVLLGGVLPFWWMVMIIGAEKGGNQMTLRNILDGVPEVKNIESLISSDEGRVYVSKKVTHGYRKAALAKLGLSTNSLPYYGIRTLSTVSKGVSYEELCKASYMYSGLNDGKECRIENDAFLDIGAAKYVIKYDGEEVKQGLSKEFTIGTGPKGVIGFYRNRMSWPEAVIMSREVLDLKLPKLDGCEGDGLGCRDLRTMRKYRIHDDSVKLHRNKGAIRLDFNHELTSNKTIMVTEYARSGWIATWYSSKQKGVVPITKIVNAFIGLDVPAGTKYVVLEYRNRIRQYLELVAILTILMCAIFLITAKSKRLSTIK